MGIYGSRVAMKHLVLASLFVLALSAAPHTVLAQAPTVPDGRCRVRRRTPRFRRPRIFIRPSRNSKLLLECFRGNLTLGPHWCRGSSNYDAARGRYTITSAGYNIWYQRDEFRFLWKKLSGDVSLSANVSFPDPKGFGDRKAVLMIRQNLDDDSKEAMIGEHGTGMIHLAYRSEKGAQMKDMTYTFGGGIAGVMASRISIEKHGDSIAILISLKGEPMHQLGPPVEVHFDGPFYVGIGFCSHLPATLDTGVLSDVVLENAAGKVQ